MPRDTFTISSNERELICSAVTSDLRLDGRGPYDYRKYDFRFLRTDGAVEVQLGPTRVLAVVEAEMQAPHRDRPNEGTLSVQIEFSPMADPAYEGARPTELAVELGRIIDRGLRESHALDMEALCILPGRYVWALRLHVHILDNGGNLIDAAVAAAVAALQTFRLQEFSLGGEDGQQVTIFSPEERDPSAWVMYHLPIAISFAVFNDGEQWVLDPSLKEEAAMAGRLTVTLNENEEVCALHKSGGVAVRGGEIMRCLRIAALNVKAISQQLKQEAEQHRARRAARKVKRHPEGGGGGYQEAVLRERGAEGVAMEEEEEGEEGEGEKWEEDVGAGVPHATDSAPPSLKGEPLKEGLNPQQGPSSGAAHADKSEGWERVVRSGRPELGWQRLAVSGRAGEVKREVKEEPRTGVEAQESLLHAVKKKKRR